MNNEQFDSKVLLRQNSEMATKLQWYRREYQQLNKNNQQLNIWVQNLSEVFAALSASWKYMTEQEETFYNLLKKKNDQNTKNMLSKYVMHFKAFDDIIDNLGEKIRNSGHSQQNTEYAKGKIMSFVKNYQLFFKELVEIYFKFNQQHKQWATQITQNVDSQQMNRNLANKEIQNRQKIKEFEIFMKTYLENYQTYEMMNKHELLDGILKQKDEQINNLKIENYRQSRKFATMVDYNQCETDKILQATQEVYECYCGGKQLQYFSKVWQQKVIQMNKINNKQENKQDQQLIEANNRELEMLKLEKEQFIQRNGSLQTKIQKVRITNRLSQELVLKSQLYIRLRQQCKNLINYSNDLLSRLHKNYQLIIDIEFRRNEELKQIKQKYQKQYRNNQNQNGSGGGIGSSMMIRIQCNFKKDLIRSIQGLKQIFKNISDKTIVKQQSRLQCKVLMESVQKDNQQLNIRVHELLKQQLNSCNPESWQYRHQKFKQVQTGINILLENDNTIDNDKLKKGWKDFTEYIRSRDKKTKDLESMLKKRQKEVQQKDKMYQVIKQSLHQTEAIYMNTKNKLDQLSHFVSNVQSEIVRITEENQSLKNEKDQELKVLNLRLKAQTEARNKMDQKVRLYENISSQIEQLTQSYVQSQQNYMQWIAEQKQVTQKLLIEMKQKQNIIKQLQVSMIERDKQIQKLCQQREKIKGQYGAICTKLHQIQLKSQFEVLKMQLQNYKRKITCSCMSRQRQVVLKTCPHIFCKKCIQDTTNNRNRKCPICATKFTKTDVHQIFWS